MWRGAFGRYRGDQRGVQGYWGDLSGSWHLEEQGIDMMKLLKLIFEKQNGSSKWTGLV